MTKERAALLVLGEIEDAFAEGVAALRPDADLLPQLEALWRTVLARHENGRSASGRQLRALYRLMRSEPLLRAAAVAVDDERRTEFVGMLADLTGAAPEDPTPALAAETSATVVRVALDRWAAAMDAGGPEPDLLATYDACVAAFRTLR